MENSNKVLMLMSGGVDSSVAAALLKKQGFSIVAVTMKIWAGEYSPGGHSNHGCYGPEEDDDIEDARRVCEQIGIRHQVVDLTDEYQSTVLDYFNAEYLTGRTPNPCVRCNLKIKFGALIDKAVEQGVGFDYIASGHYAKIQFEPASRRYLLKKAFDLSKDQSYFLSALSQKQLQRLVFPLGSMTKMEVRRIATELTLPVAEKPDSQNFISGNYCSVIKSNANPGDIVDKFGTVKGRHAGIQYYTIGQRKGLGISSAKPVYVTAIDAVNNNVVIGERNDLYHQEFCVTNLNWIAIPTLTAPMTLNVKIRSSHKEAEAEVTPLDPNTVRVKFIKPQFAVTPGQTSVFYEGDVVVGGGIIDSVSKNN
ncbi:MAG TPA: tRNA 2-thiouridine(34) synthase MnmA [Dehalococcoidales bacterium]|nr:tRNA 2-thiouridine(34) synthase MnmA [Dehalococcoidales bacterium]